MQRAGGHQKGTSKEGHAASRCFVLGWCRMGAAARRAWGVSVVQTRGGVRFPGGKGGVVCGVLSPSLRGGAASYGLPPLLCLGVDPPWCSTDPASPTAALQKGLCWGVCRLYPGLRGCVRRRKRRKGAESCCLLLKRLERCEGTRKKARHGERGVLLLRWWCSSLPPPCKAWGGL